MGFRNPPVPWTELERRLSGRTTAAFPDADGGDSPAWSHHRGDYQPPPNLVRRSGGIRYAELHCHSHFSFLDGSSSPEELVEEAARLGLEALALTDHDGMYGVVRFSEAAKAVGLPTIFGAELSLGLSGSQAGRADPEGNHVVVLARNPSGYGRLCQAISAAQLAGKEKGRPVYDLEALAGTCAGEWLWLTGCRKGVVPAALVAAGPAAARRELARLVEVAGGRSNVGVELWDHGDPLDSTRNDALLRVAEAVGVECVATNNVHYDTPARQPLATAMAAVRARRSLDDLDGWLPAAATAHLRSGGEQDWWFRRFPGVVERAAEWGLACAFDLSLVAPNLPRYPCPDGQTEAAYLRHLVGEGADRRYGPTGTPRRAEAQPRIDHELKLIEDLGWPGYFLLVWDIVRFCNEANIYVQGRGSAVGSAVCFTLGITSIDPIARKLLFERFLSAERGSEPPDIDLDIESGEREQAIQYVYDRYGRSCAAQVANVITYRSRSAVRDMAKALGYSTGQQDAWSKQIERGPVRATAGLPADAHTIPTQVLALAGQLENAPRHLGIHSGGMVLADRPISEVCPIEWARHEGRTVLQWDKDDCERAGLVKIDLLGLGMLSAIHYTIDLVNTVHGADLALHNIPAEDSEVYDMICAADAIGVFQIESRAQMQTSPRLKPRNFYDLAVQIAIIRPGPIQGGSVHPYLRRRAGEEDVTYLHPLLEPILYRTKGIPLFQEQLMEIARQVGGFSAGQADELRRAMGSKRSKDRMEALRDRLYEGMAARGITAAIADELWTKLAAFSDYGFPESHALAFAHLAYVSSWLKRWYPAAFCAGLLNAQPMGFYSPHSLVRDARRHGVTVWTPDINASDADATLDSDDDHRPQPAPPGRSPQDWGSGGPAVRLGLSQVRTIGDDLARHLVAERAERGRYQSMEDLVRRVPDLTLPQIEALATAGAFGGLGLDRRQALWSAGAVAQARADRLPGIIAGATAPSLPVMTARQVAHADLWATAISPDGHPTQFVRSRLAALGVIPVDQLAQVQDGTRIAVAGIVTHRQRPATAGGITFLNLEDESGMVNVICSPGCWNRFRPVVQSAGALLIRGTLQNTHDVVNVVAEHVEQLALATPNPSRDFR
jgi:error-prone DNA polymerase